MFVCIAFSVHEHLERFHHFLDYERYEFESTMRYINTMQDIQSNHQSHRPNTSESQNLNRPQSPAVVPETPRSPSLFDEDTQSTNFEEDDGIEILQAAAAAGASEQLQRVPEVQRVEEEEVEVDVGVEEQVVAVRPVDRTEVRDFIYRLRRPQFAQTQADLKCAICLENYLDQAPVSTPCGHIFCSDCLMRWYISVNEARDVNLPAQSFRDWISSPCPECRRDIMLAQCFQIFFN